MRKAPDYIVINKQGEYTIMTLDNLQFLLGLKREQDVLDKTWELGYTLVPISKAMLTSNKARKALECWKHQKYVDISNFPYEEQVIIQHLSRWISPYDNE